MLPFRGSFPRPHTYAYPYGKTKCTREPNEKDEATKVVSTKIDPNSISSSHFIAFPILLLVSRRPQLEAKKKILGHSVPILITLLDPFRDVTLQTLLLLHPPFLASVFGLSLSRAATFAFSEWE